MGSLFQKKVWGPSEVYPLFPPPIPLLFPPLPPPLGRPADMQLLLDQLLQLHRHESFTLKIALRGILAVYEQSSWKFMHSTY